ncbi:hypothetical protein PVAND_007191 [Polypedilum vanderplanki]|uniref:ATPase AAA-type core domain-containing protein n=1 Tax=Polypedilum vanderplanki TaxID=319348 RepID=A0A9J6C5N9_POLVA|nr:hypothetical protein PVAND_007191 [Polypedilum vanderplanki]
MDDETIVENMKAVLKSTKKKKAAKINNNKSQIQNNDSSKNDELISDLMNKNWQMKSPVEDNNGKTAANIASGKKLTTNIFEKMMNATRRTANDSPSSQKSDDSPLNNTVSNHKKKRKYKRKGTEKMGKKIEAEKFETESEISVLDEESLLQDSIFKDSIEPVHQISYKPLEQISISGEETARKRNRTNDIEQLNSEKTFKRRKTKDSKVLLDSNENSLPMLNTEENSASGRPRRSCNNIRIDYSLLDSPEKEFSKKRKVNHKIKIDPDEDCSIIEIDENSLMKKQSQKGKNIPEKLAPIFIKKIPKPALDPAVIKARRNFLLSELPANLKAPIEQQRKFEDDILSNNLIAYPVISHITQQQTEIINNNDGRKLYSNSKIILNDNVEEEEEETCERYRKFKWCMVKEQDAKNLHISNTAKRELIHDIKIAVRKIKDKCENFQINRCFKQILNKLKNARSNDVDDDENINSSNFSYQHSLFVDIFKPLKVDEYLIGAEPIKKLEEFFKTLNEKNFINDYYDSDESSSRHSTMRGYNNVVVLSGNYGSGKSSSVYALANDLNYEVIEINAGSKRNGKKILQDLLEATQSHRVEKHLVEDEDSLNNGFCINNGIGSDSDKRTIILIEDAELTFENDDGFISSIHQLINNSKRPVILTTNDRSCQHLQKFIQYNEIIYDYPKSFVTKYLSLITLATSNYKIDETEIEHLFALNRCDLRKTINEIEFFIRSDSASINSGSLMELYGISNSLKKKNNQKNQLTTFYGKQHKHSRRENLSKLHFETSIFTSQCTALITLWNKEQQRWSSRGNEEFPYHQKKIINEMANYFERSNLLQMEYEHDFAQRQQRIISRSISNEVNVGNVSTRAKILDIAPFCRSICRSEKQRETTRRSNRNHYLKYVMPNKMNLNDYFDEQIKIFEITDS